MIHTAYGNQIVVLPGSTEDEVRYNYVVGPAKEPRVLGIWELRATGGIQEILEAIKAANETEEPNE